MIGRNGKDNGMDHGGGGMGREEMGSDGKR
jgi:hypothetical protein